MKKLITFILRLLAHYKVKRTRPKIIGITGSYGKTTMKEILAEVLGHRFRVLKNEKSLNTDIGMCLAILEQPSGFSVPIKWIKILIAACVNAFFSKPYEFFVLEYGVDKPGDMDALLAIAKPDIAVITAIAQVHQAAGQFRSLEEVATEKSKLALAVSQNGLVILNHSYKELERTGKAVQTHVEDYNDTHTCAVDLSQKEKGIEFNVLFKGKKHHVRMPVIGTYHTDCALVSLIIGTQLGLDESLIIRALHDITLPPGRMSLIAGVHGATLIDSSYNASPDTVNNALSLLKEFPASRRIAVLGTMNELGNFFEKGHEKVVPSCGEWLDVLIGVGEGGEFIAKHALKQSQKPTIIRHFTTAIEAAEYLKKELTLREGDVILFKGSQNNVRLERAVKILMAHPEEADRLLCRQEIEWKKIR